MTDNNTQIVLVDTPGVINKEHGKKHHLERSLIVDPESSLQTVDLIAVLVDASQRYTEYGLDRQVLDMLYRNPYTETILILNKVDRIKKKSKLLEISRTLTSGIVDSKPVPRFEPITHHLTKAQKALLWQEQQDGTRAAEIDPEVKFWEDVEAYARLTTVDERKMFVEKKTGWPKFKEVFMISALDGDGIGELKVGYDMFSLPDS